MKKNTVKHFKNHAQKTLTERRTKSVNKKASKTKEAWIRLLKDPKTKRLIQKAWSSKNPKKDFEKVIKKVGSKIK